MVKVATFKYNISTLERSIAMETVSLGTKQLDFGYSRDNILESPKGYDIHCHNSYEVYYFLSGDVSYLVEGRHYTPTPHSILMISPNILHGVKAMPPLAYERYTLHFSAEVIPVENRFSLLSPFHQSSSQSDIYYQSVKDFDLENYFQRLLTCYHMPDDMRHMATTIAVQSLLSQILYMSKQTKSLAPKQNSPQIITNIINYINDNISEKITLDDISAKFFISKHHLNKVFREATGTTLLQYVNHKKIATANHYLMQGKTATAVAAAVGFNDYSVFYRAYKRIIGHAPTHNKSE